MTFSASSILVFSIYVIFSAQRARTRKPRALPWAFLYKPFGLLIIIVLAFLDFNDY
tara:strand:- start:9223 stop:9390 length:168 start_codon:yes stop_codon:yes gene_type:complete